MGVVLSRFRGFLRELKRRKVVRVAVAYGAMAFVIVQAADIAFPALHFPDWTLTFLVVMAILGFPVALLLSWAYELTPDPGPPQDAAGAAAPLAVRERAPEYGADAADAEAAARPAGASAPGRGLPPQPTPFIGRRAELEHLARLLADPASRLITVTGPGGIGKTRLALRAAEENADAFAHGPHYVELGRLDSIEWLVPTIAGRLGLALSPREDPKQQLFDYLRGKQLLLVLDNFEHLAGGAELLAEILENAPEVTLIATSRERLQLHGEALLPLQGLNLPDGGTADEAEHCDAVQLFLLGARRVQPDFSADGAQAREVVRICRLVEGIPLAIELASTWVRTLSPAEIVQEIERNHDFLAGSMRDVPERHRSVRAVFDSAWRLLSDDERRAFRRLSVFRGGFRRDAAERVAGASMLLLSSLIDKSLLRRSPAGRFEVLEVLRQHAADRLDREPDEHASVRERHGEYFASFLHALRERFEGANEKDAVEAVAGEIENVREAWRWAVHAQRDDCIARSLDSLYTFFDARGWVREGEELFGAAAAGLKKGGDAQTAVERELLQARLLVRQGAFSSELGLALRARELLQKGLARLREADRPRDTAFALDQLGTVHFKTGEYLEAREQYTESVGIYRALGDARGSGRGLMHVGNVAFALGDYPAATQLFRESLGLLEEAGDRRGMSTCLRNLGVVAGERGEAEEARRFFHGGLAIDREIGHTRGLALSLQNLGSLAWLAGEYRQADAYLREAIVICEEIGSRRLLAFCLNVQGRVARALDRRQGSRSLFAQALAIARQIGEAPLMLEILIGVAQLRADEEQIEEAVELLSLVLAHPAGDQGTHDGAQSLMSELGEKIPRPAFLAAVERGKDADLDLAVRQVLEEAAALSVSPQA